MPAALTIGEKRDRALAKIAEQAGQEKQVREEGQRTNEEGATRKRGAFNGTVSKLTVGHLIEGYHLHFLNDSGSRIAEALSGGYEFVKPEEVGSVNNNTDLSDKIRIVAGTNDNGDALYAYLMKIRQDWYDEDQKEIERRVDAVDDVIRGGKSVAGNSEGFYTPKDGITYKQD